MNSGQKELDPIDALKEQIGQYESEISKLRNRVAGFEFKAAMDQDHESTIIAIRTLRPVESASFPDRVIAVAYSWYCEDTCACSWKDHTSVDLARFCDWCFRGAIHAIRSGDQS